MSDLERIDPDAIPHEMQERRDLAEQLAATASQAFHGGEVERATLHACDLLMLFPNERRYLDLFDEIVLSVDDPLALVQVDPDDVRVATAAGRARVLMMGRRLPEALQILCRAVDLAPHAPYLHWILRWLQPQILQTLDPRLLSATVVQTAVEMALDTPVPPWRHDRRVPNLRAGAELLAAIRQIYPEEATLFWGEAEIRRRLKEPDQVVALAEEALRRYPEDAAVLRALAHAYSDADRPDEALAHARKAVELSVEDPPSLTPLAEAGDAFLDAERWADAEAVFAEIAERDPHHPGAQASVWYARWRATGSEDAALELARLRERRIGDARTRELADEADRPVPFVNVLPPPADAGAEGLRAYADELRHIKPLGVLDGPVNVTLRTRYLESPSLTVAFDVAARALGTIGTLTFAIEALPDPDPRSDKAQVSAPIWRWDTLVPTPVHTDGNADAQAAVAGIARMPFHRDTWTAAARQVADRFGNEGFHGMLSVLTHPPPQPDDFDAVTWTWRCQVAAAIVIAHLGGWEGGAARAGIYSMLYGPSDWVTAAAVVALAWRAAQTPAIRPEVESTFGWMKTIVPNEGVAAWEGPLVDAWRTLDHDEERRAELDAWSERYHATVGDRDAARPVARGYGGLTIEAYAAFSAARDRIVTAEGGIPTVGPGRASIPEPPAGLAELCTEYGVPLRHPGTFAIHPYVDAWEAAFAASPPLERHFLTLRRTAALAHLGMSAEEKAALEAIREGKQLREAASQGEDGGATGEDPVLFPGEPLEKLSDYVDILKEMQRGDMDSTLRRRGLDMPTYASIAQKWSARLQSDPGLTARFHRLMDA